MDRLISGFYSSGSPLAWQWIIEYLSSFPQIDTSIISSLIKTAPISPEEFNENTDERVALRCLEELFGPDNSSGSVAPPVSGAAFDPSPSCGTDNSSGSVAPPVSGAAFDPSLSCGTVLNHILEEVPFLNLKKAAPELSRWDGHSFIKHKRATLPKCALEKLKDLVLADVPASDGHKNGPPSRSDDNDDKNGNQEGNLIPQIHENDNESPLFKNLLPSKRCRDDLVSGNPMGLVNVNHGHLHNYLCLNAKKFKLDATPSCTVQPVEELPIHLHGGYEQLEDESQRITEIEGNNLGKDSQIGEVDTDLCVASRTHGPVDVVGRAELLDDQMENVQNDNADVIVEHKHGSITCQNVVINESNPIENGALQKDPSGDAGMDIDQDFTLNSRNSISTDGLQRNIDSSEKADLDHPCPEEIFEDEIFNNAVKKNIFLSSHRKASHDPVQKDGWTEQNSCVKCNQNGQVLVCSASGCTLVVHERCLNCAARFDDKGNFVCPFCAYSLSISKYLEAKEKTILGRKKLAAFMRLMGKLTQEWERSPSHSTLNGDDHPTTKNTEIVSVNQVEVEGDNILKEAVGPQTTDACLELVHSGGKGSSTSRFREHLTKFSSPPTRQSRKKVLWTNEEEEILRKGVDEFTCRYDGTIPWTRILEFGSQVFPKDKTPTDLKNKWRAMCKGSPNCK